MAAFMLVAAGLRMSLPRRLSDQLWLSLVLMLITGTFALVSTSQSVRSNPFNIAFTLFPLGFLNQLLIGKVDSATYVVLSAITGFTIGIIIQNLWWWKKLAGLIAIGLLVLNSVSFIVYLILLWTYIH
jgi:hypothetical protein